MSNSPASWPAQTREYLTEVQVEFKKITWPTQKETVAGTIGTCVVVAVISAVLFAVDGSVGWVIRSVFG